MTTINITESLALRSLNHNYAQLIFDIIDSEREYLGRWLPFVSTTNKIEDTANALNYIIDEKNPTFAILLDGEFIGLIGFKGTDYSNKKSEIGYWMSQKFQGRGIMTNCVNALCCYAFETMGINRIQIKCAIGNTPSSNIPKRLGFQFEGIERAGELVSEGIYRDVEVYSKLINDK